MRILGIDPGSRIAGHALIEWKDGEAKYLSSGIVKSGHKNFFHRLADIKEQFDIVIRDASPDEVALESLIYVKNPNSLAKLAQARGIILSTVIAAQISSIYEYAPNEIKAVTTGHGLSDKLVIQEFLGRYFQIDSFKSADESDALAIAFCHVLQRPSE